MCLQSQTLYDIHHGEGPPGQMGYPGSEGARGPKGSTGAIKMKSSSFFPPVSVYIKNRNWTVILFLGRGTRFRGAARSEGERWTNGIPWSGWTTWFWTERLKKEKKNRWLAGFVSFLITLTRDGLTGSQGEPGRPGLPGPMGLKGKYLDDTKRTPKVHAPPIFSQ